MHKGKKQKRVEKPQPHEQCDSDVTASHESIVVSPPLLFSGTRRGLLRAWTEGGDHQNANVLLYSKEIHHGPVNFIVENFTGDLIASGGADAVCAIQPRINFLTNSTNNTVLLKGHRRPCTSAHFLSDSVHVVTCGLDGYVLFHNIKLRCVIRKIDVFFSISVSALPPTEKFVVVGGTQVAVVPLQNEVRSDTKDAPYEKLFWRTTAGGETHEVQKGTFTHSQFHDGELTMSSSEYAVKWVYKNDTLCAGRAHEKNLQASDQVRQRTFTGVDIVTTLQLPSTKIEVDTAPLLSVALRAALNESIRLKDICAQLQ